MDCAKCSDTGVTRCPFDGEAQLCPCVAGSTETEGARIGEEIRLPPTEIDQADAAMIAVREDAEFLWRYSTPSTDHVLAAIARAAVAQTLLVERMVWVFEQMLEESQRV